MIVKQSSASVVIIKNKNKNKYMYRSCLTHLIEFSVAPQSEGDTGDGVS